VFQKQFIVISADDKNIKREDMARLMNACGQNTQPNQLEAACKELKYDAKPQLTLEEAHKVAEIVWIQKQAQPTQQQQPAPQVSRKLVLLYLFRHS
jgi:hypothetical protein